MVLPQLTISYRPEDNRVGELTVTASSADYAGKASAWFGKKVLRDKLLTPLKKRPLSSGKHPLLASGLPDDAASNLEECHVRLILRPYDDDGHIFVQADLATAAFDMPEADLQLTLTVRFLARYDTLDRFTAELADVLTGKRATATLTGI